MVPPALPGEKDAATEHAGSGAAGDEGAAGKQFWGTARRNAVFVAPIARIAEDVADDASDEARWRAKVAFRRSVAKICNAKQLADLRDRMQMGGGALVLGPGLPRDVRVLAAPERATTALNKGEQPPKTAPPPESRGEGPDRRATRRLLRLADPHSRMSFVRDHPFLKDTSMAFRTRLAPQLVRRNAESTAEIVEQGVTPSGSMDYLFLTAPDLKTKVEILLDGRPIVVLSGSAVFGQEVVFGVAKTFVFGARVAPGLDSAASLWVIPRKVIKSLLAKEAHREDAELLQAKARETTSEILRNWYSHPTAHIRLRLFENAEPAFKRALVQAVTMQVHSAGEVLRRSGVLGEDTCFCVFRGEASAHVADESESTAKLSHASGTSAWAAWWGLLEVLGVCARSPAEVRAVTDVVIWYLSPEALRSLRKTFPIECRLFDKVAREHARLLQSTAPLITEAPLFSGLDAELLEDLLSSVNEEVYSVGSAILCEGDLGEDLLFLARGRACVRRQHAERGLPGHPTPSRHVGEKKFEKRPMSILHVKTGLTTDFGATRNPMLEKVVVHLPEGSFFGEATVLGYCNERTASVVCETVCDVRSLPGERLIELMEEYPGLRKAMLSLAHQNGCRLRCEGPNRNEGEDLEAIMSLELSVEILRALDADMGRLLTVRGQALETQGESSSTWYILVEGMVEVEVDGRRVHDIKAPALLGEQALLQPGGPLSASLRSHGVCCFRTLEAQRARQLLECLPADRDKLLRAAHASLEEFIANITGLKRGAGRRKSMKADAGARGVLGADEKPSDENGAPRRDSIGTEEGDDGVNFIDGRPTVVFLSRFFQESDQGFLQYILLGMQKVIFIDQEVMMREGDEGDFAVCIHRGSGTVEIGGVKVGEVKAGSLIGEAAVFGEGAKRTATVRSVGMVSAYKLPRTVLLEAFEEYPEERKHIEDLARLRGLTNKVLTAPPKKVENAEDHGSSPTPKTSRLTDKNSSIFGSVARAGPGGSRLGSALQQPARQGSRFQRAYGKSIFQSHSLLKTAAHGPDRRSHRFRRLALHSAGHASHLRVFKEVKQSNLVHEEEHEEERHSPSSGSDSSSGSDGESSSPAPSSMNDCIHEEDHEDLERAHTSHTTHVCPPTASSANSATSSRMAQAPEASVKCSEWVQRRRAQIRDAPLRRNERLARRGDMLPLVPCTQGYHSDEADIRAQTPAWSVRLRRAEGVYAPPVWHEVYGF